MLLQIFSASEAGGQKPLSPISGVNENIFGFVDKSAPYIQSSESPDAGYKEALIFDAGCGTGLVGQQLKKYDYKNFHGADLSQKLLDSIPENLYQKLIKVDLNQTINVSDNSYNAVMCVGTFTFGHVKPQAIDEFIRITKKDGLICFTINEGIYKEYGFDKKIDELKKDDKWEELEFFKSDYIASKDVNAWLGLYKVK